MGAAAAGMSGAAADDDAPKIPGFEEEPVASGSTAQWKPVSDRRVRVGIVGYGTCRVGAAFSFQDHPNVEVVAVSDLCPARCAALAKACRCEKT